MSSRWSDPPSDILSIIADHLDHGVGVTQLRSICKSWRSSLSSHPCSSITFPVIVPFPLSDPTSHLSLVQRSTYLLSPLCNPNSSIDGFLIKVEESANSSNTFSLINPLFGRVKLPPPISPINLLDYRITHLCTSYVVRSDLQTVQVPIKKVVVARDFLAKGDFVVLGLKYNGDLLFWKFGDENWTEILASGRCFDDIICFKSKFYATADQKGRLVMIDSRLKPIDLVPKLMYGNGVFTSLVEYDGNLYLIDRVVAVGGSKFGVFKLDDKGRFWDYEPSLNGSAFFLGDDANFSFSGIDYNGCTKDVIYFKNVVLNENDNGGFSQVFDIKTGYNSFVLDEEKFVKFYWPPSSWFAEPEADCFR